jgi:hypothetical protein
MAGQGYLKIVLAYEYQPLVVLALDVLGVKVIIKYYILFVEFALGLNPRLCRRLKPQLDIKSVDFVQSFYLKAVHIRRRILFSILHDNGQGTNNALGKLGYEFIN